MFKIKEKTNNSKYKNKYRIIFNFSDFSENDISQEIIIDEKSKLLLFVEKCISKLEDIGKKSEAPKWLDILEKETGLNLPKNQNTYCYYKLDYVTIKYYNANSIEHDVDYIEEKIADTFMFTGKLENYTRAEAEKLVIDKGYKITKNIDYNLTYLVVSDKSGSKYNEAKKYKTIIIMDEYDFENFIN